jgi:hypothetical protein
MTTEAGTTACPYRAGQRELRLLTSAPVGPVPDTARTTAIVAFSLVNAVIRNAGAQHPTPGGSSAHLRGELRPGRAADAMLYLSRRQAW